MDRALTRRAAQSQRDGRERDEAWWEGLRARLREAVRGRSYKELAVRTGYNAETVRRYFGSGRASARFVAEVCRALDVDPGWLLATGRCAKYRQPRAHTRARVLFDLLVADRIEVVRAEAVALPKTSQAAANGADSSATELPRSSRPGGPASVTSRIAGVGA